MKTNIMKMHLLGISLVIALDCILVSFADVDPLIMFNAKYNEYIEKRYYKKSACPETITSGLKTTMKEFAKTLPGFDGWHQELSRQINFFHMELKKRDKETLARILYVGFRLLHYGDMLALLARKYRPECYGMKTEEKLAIGNDYFMIASLMSWTVIFMPIAEIFDVLNIDSQFAHPFVPMTKEYFLNWKRIHLTRILQEVNRPGDLEILRERTPEEQEEILSQEKEIEYEYLENQEDVLKKINCPIGQQEIIESLKEGFRIQLKQETVNVGNRIVKIARPRKFENIQIINDFPPECLIGTNVEELQERAEIYENGIGDLSTYESIVLYTTQVLIHIAHYTYQPSRNPAAAGRKVEESLIYELRNLGLTEPEPSASRNVFSKIIDIMQRWGIK